MKRIWLTAAALCIGTALPCQAEDGADDVPRALHSYVERDEPVFAWKIVDTAETDAGHVTQVSVTSQRWHGITWKHAVEVYQPKKVIFPRHALLFVTGGSRPGPPSQRDVKFGLSLATQCGARVVMLRQVPNQPLFGGRKEDDLITDTWLKYLDSGDETWPLLFPMVKSAVKTMDAIQELSEKQWDARVEHFVITGASKRGWTSWLTPVVDKRVAATAPIVIDVLNFRAQIKHQLDTWGKFSEQIIDYESKGLLKRPGEEETPREVALRLMMDPFTYRKHLTLPKLMIVGTNDRYWVVDSMKHYWDGLVGEKYVRQVPNAGHGLDGGRDGALTTLAVFFRHVAGRQKLPRVSWDFSKNGKELQLAVSADPAPAKVRLWTAKSSDLDFRDDRWQSEVLNGDGNGKAIGSVAVPDAGHVALFGEMEFEIHGLPWSLTTLVFRH